MDRCFASISLSPGAWFIIYIKSEFSKIFSISRLARRSLMFCVMAVGIPLNVPARFQIYTE